MRIMIPKNRLNSGIALPPAPSSSLLLPGVEVLERGFQTIGVIPAFVESFEDVRELRFGEAVEMRDDGVELVDHVLLFIFRKRPAFDADRFGPLAVPLVRAREPAGKRDRSLP